MPKKVLKHSFQNKKITFLLLVIVSLFLRVLWLDKFPIGITHDELNYIMNAKSVFNMGENIPWTSSALFSWGEKDFNVVISELPSLIIAPWIGLTRLNQFNARIPYAIVSTLSVIFLFLILCDLLGEKVAFWAGLTMALNPWSIHFGRTAFEVNFALLFYLVGIYLILKGHSWKIFYGFLFFLAGFLSYLGTKLLFLPLFLIVLLFKYYSFEKRKGKAKPYVYFGVLASFIVLLYYLTLPFQPAGSRTGEILLFNTSSLSSVVNNERRQSISNVALSLFSNKAMAFTKRAANTYIEAFSTSFLFVKGETRGAYSFWQHGPFYLIDFPLILLGMFGLFLLKRRVFWFILLIIAVSPLVSSIAVIEQSYVMRSFPMFPFLAALVGIGIWYLKEKFRFGRLIVWPVIILYLFSVASFLHLYFYRYSVYASEGWFFSEKILSKYSELAQADQRIEKVYIITPEPKIVFESYLFHSGLYEEKNEIELINKRMKRKDFSAGKVRFINSCPSEIGIEVKSDDVLIVDRRFSCGDEKGGNGAIASLADAGRVFVIKNDLVCRDINLDSYYVIRSMDELKINNMLKDEFCREWIVKI